MGQQLPLDVEVVGVPIQGVMQKVKKSQEVTQMTLNVLRLGKFAKRLVLLYRNFNGHVTFSCRE